jgi:hypothetical protein
MHRLVIAGALALTVAFCGRLGAAQEAEPVASTPAPEFSRFTVGAYAALGMAALIGDPYIADAAEQRRYLRPRFAGGGGAYFDVYLNRNVALDLGLGFLGKGCRYDNTSPIDGHATPRTLMLRYLQIPLGVKLSARGFRLSAAVALEIGLSGATTIRGAAPIDNHLEQFWESNRRVNFGPMIEIGYAIPIGSRLRIVPSISWSMHALDDNTCGAPTSEHSCDPSPTWRYTNLMFQLGAEIDFEGRGAAAGITGDVGTFEAAAAADPQTVPEPARAPAPTEIPSAAAQPANRYPRFTVGAFFGLGMAHARYEGEYHYALEPRLAFNGGAYFIHHLSKVVAYDVGLELVDKGCVVLGNPLWERTIPFRVLYLEIPLGVKIFFAGFAIGAALGVDYAVYKEFTDEQVNHWDAYNRFNLSPRLTLEYRIPAGGVASVLVGVTGSIEAFNSVDRIWGEDSSRYRNINIMFNLGVEAGFGGGE